MDDVPLRRSQRETLTYPRVDRYWDDDDQKFIARYATTCISSLLQSDIRLQWLGLGMISWDVLAQLSDLWHPPRVLPALDDLEALSFYPFFPDVIFHDENEQAKGMSAVTKMIAAAPNLFEFEWWCGPKVFGPEYVEPMPLCLADLYQCEVPWLLQSVDIAGIECTAQELHRLFDRLSGTLKHVKLAMMDLEMGVWVEVFEDMRETLPLDIFELSLWFSEFDTISGRGGTWFANPKAAEGTLLDSIQDYVTYYTDETLWKRLTEGGSLESWAALSDKSMRYRHW